MRKNGQRIGLFMILMIGVGSMVGCSSFWGGTATGGVVGAGAYEIHANQEMKKIDEDLKAGRIDQREYDIRKEQIKRDSIFQ